MPLVLVPLNGDRPVPLDKAIVFFGRGQECDVILTNSRKVSRRHCCVAQIDDHYIVRDLGSMNGVRINGKLVKQEAGIAVGDELCIGDQVFRLEALNTRVPPKGKSPPPINPDLLSGDIPIALPEESEDFAVEETGARHFPPPLPDENDSSDVIRLVDDDLDAD